MKRIIIILLLLFSIKSPAQDSTNKSTGFITKKWIGSYRMNEIRLTEKELKAELYKAPAAIPLYKKAKTSKIIGYSFIVPILISAILSNQNSNKPRDSVYKANGFQIVGILAGGASIFFLSRSFNLYKKAVRARNSNRKPIY